MFFLEFWRRFPASKVGVFRQWARALREGCAKIPLFVGMDETSLAFHFGGGKGTIISKRALPKGRRHKRESGNLADRRAYVSHLAFITHDSAIQPRLPQIFIGNKDRFPLKLMEALAPHKPPNVYLWREESSWNNHKLMCRMIHLLVKLLADLLVTHQLILVVDCAKCHIHRTIFACATKLGVRLLYIPAKLTWLLQPADTHAFALLKRRLRERFLQLRIASATGEVSHEAWMKAVFSVVRSVLCGNRWEPAFKAAGLLDDGLSDRVVTELGWEAVKPVEHGLPTQEQLQVLFPKRTRINRDTVLRWAVPKAKAKAKAGAAPPGPSGSDAPLLD